MQTDFELPEGYSFIEEISRDGHGVLLRVHDPLKRIMILRIVPLKEVPQAAADNRKRFCRLMDRGQHLVRIGHAGIYKDFLFYEMPVPDTVPGIRSDPVPAVLNILYASRREGTEKVLQTGLDLLDALERLHKAGIVHGNVRPSAVAYYDGVPALGDIGSGEENLPREYEYLPPEDAGKPKPYCMEYDLYALGRLLLNIAAQPESPQLQKTAGLLCAEDPRKRITRIADAQRIFGKRMKKRKRGCIIAVFFLLVTLFLMGSFSAIVLSDGGVAGVSLPFMKKKNRNTPLIHAIRGKNLEKIQELLQTENPDEPGKNGMCPLHVAVLCDFPDAVQTLILHKADVNKADNKGNTPLHLASEKGNTKILELLIKAGADTKIADNNGLTPADRAKKAGHPKLAEELEKKITP